MAVSFKFITKSNKIKKKKEKKKNKKKLKKKNQLEISFHLDT